MRRQKLLSFLPIMLCFILLSLAIKAYFDGKFDSVESLREYVRGFGAFAPAVLTLIQAMQVIFPVLPGFLGCAVGTVMFGSLGGFLCNYIGISAGSITAFILAKKCGTPLVKKIFPKGKYEKYSEWAGKSKAYTALLVWGMILPLFPDDFFCYFSGLTKMSLKKFAAIIILSKPWCILVYSLIFSKI